MYADSELMPLSGAIENTGGQADRLAAATESFNATERILYAYKHYNRLMMTGKLRAYIAALCDLDRTDEELARLSASKADTENGVILNNETIGRLCNETDECERIIGELGEKYHNEAEATKRLTRLRVEAEGAAEDIVKKNGVIAAKKAQISQTGDVIKTLETEAQWRAGKIGAMMKTLANLANEAAFAGHDPMAGAFCPQDEFNFSGVKEAVKGHGKALREGLGILGLLNALSAGRDELNGRIEDGAEALKHKSEEYRLAESAFIEQKNELLLALAYWETTNTRLTILPDMAEGLNNAVRAYQYADGRPRLNTYIDELYFALRGAIDQKIGAKKLEIRKLKEEKDGKQAEIRRIREIREIEPPRGPEVIRSREYLSEHGIPYTPFYKTLRFKPGVRESDANRVEEALWRMGILDACVVPEKYREAVLKASAENSGMADKFMFIFDKQPKMDKTYDMTGLLEIGGHTDADTMVDNALKAVYYEVESHTTVFSPGVYRIGALTGTSSGDYAAKYIGEAARGRNRQAAIHALQIEIEGLIRLNGVYESEIEGLKAEAAALADEYGRMPGMERLEETAAVMRGLDRDIQFIRNEYEGLSARAASEDNAIAELNGKLAGLHEQTSLPPDLKTYRFALDSMEEYYYSLAELMEEHGSLLANMYRSGYERDHLDSLDVDLDNLICDAGGLARRQDFILAEIAEIEERLRASGYEEVVKTIGAKRYRIEEIRNCLDILRKTSGALEDKLKGIDEDIAAAKLERAARERECGTVRRILEDEAALGYTDESGVNTDDRAGVNRALNRLEMGKRDFAGKTAEDMEIEVHSRLVENLRYLSEYAPAEEEVFEQNPEINLKIKRVVINCVTESGKMDITALNAMLGKEIEVLRDMIEGHGD